MKKPSNIIFKLGELGLIHTLTIKQIQTGASTAKTVCYIQGEEGSCKGNWDTYSPYLDVKVKHNSIATLHPERVTELLLWRKFEESNKAELVEYERLKAKYN